MSQSWILLSNLSLSPWTSKHFEFWFRNYLYHLFNDFTFTIISIGDESCTFFLDVRRHWNNSNYMSSTSTIEIPSFFIDSPKRHLTTQTFYSNLGNSFHLWSKGVSFLEGQDNFMRSLLPHANQVSFLGELDAKVYCYLYMFGVWSELKCISSK